ncbi:glutamyl-tRNA reductase [Candidatus Mycalebacterium sp.]
MSTVVVCGISHKTSPIEERERISFAGETPLSAPLLSLASKPAINECVIVSTCNRVEIYAVCESNNRCFDEISEFLCEFNDAIHSDFIEKKFYFHEGVDAVCHLHKVAAGMDSMVVGEPQILGQLKRSYETALENHTVGTVLNKLFQSSFATTKKIKNETGVGSHMVSVSSVAAKLARNIFGEIEKCSVMIVGTGEAAQDAAVQLAKRGAGQIRIAARNSVEAAKLASSLGAETLALGEIGLWLRKTDIVISATGSSGYILKHEDLSDTMKLRKNKPISLIDIAFPRDIDPKVRDIEGVFLYDMDDLRNIVDNNLDSLRKSLDRAEEMIKDAGEKFVFWHKGLKAFPLIVELKRKTEESAREEVLKTIAKIDSIEKSGLGKEERDKAIEHLAHTLTGKFLHAPVTKLKQDAANAPNQISYVEIVRSLFELSETSVEPSKDENQNRKQG